MEHGFTWSSIVILVLLLLVIFGVRWTAPMVTKSVQSVQAVAVPSVQITEYPLVGCSVSRVYFGIGWR